MGSVLIIIISCLVPIILVILFIYYGVNNAYLDDIKGETMMVDAIIKESNMSLNRGPLRIDILFN